MVIVYILLTWNHTPKGVVATKRRALNKGYGVWPEGTNGYFMETFVEGLTYASMKRKWSDPKSNPVRGFRTIKSVVDVIVSRATGTR
jgi:hypothetical protein